jgi:hypothetical protein
MVFPVYLQRSAVAAILDCPVRHQFTGPESLKPVALQLIWLFQEARLSLLAGLVINKQSGGDFVTLFPTYLKSGER